MKLRFFLPCMLLALSTFAYKEKYSCRKNAPCGCQRQEPPVPKIVGGETVRKRTWGWIVSLTQWPKHTHFCGGSIISSLWILTAAHCLSGSRPSEIIINAGSNHLHYSTQKRGVARIYSHPKFDPDTNDNDIALLLLSSPLNMTDRALAKICLPRKTISMDDLINDSVSVSEYPPLNSKVVAIGWGHKAEHVTTLSEELQEVTLDTIAHESNSCRPLITSKERQFCAGVHMGDKDACDGDSGGPLMRFSSDKQWILAGVTSGGYGCAQVEYAGLYTRVAFYPDWIREITSKHYYIGDDHLIIVEDKINSTSSGVPRANFCSHYFPASLRFILLSVCSSILYVR